ncbi:MAG: sensor histidine kinase [Neomegalonema sp.]
MSSPRATDVRISGALALAAAAPALFAPLAVLALSVDQAPVQAMIAAVAGAAPLVIIAGIAAARPVPRWAFALAAVPLAFAAAGFSWISVGGARSPATPWVMTALVAIAAFGGWRGSLGAAVAGIVLGALYISVPEPSLRLFGRAPLAQRELASIISWSTASIAIAAVCAAAAAAWAKALPALRHPTIAARRSLELLSEGAASCGLRVGEDGLILSVVGAPEQAIDFDRKALTRLSIDALAHPDDAATIKAMLDEAKAADALTRGPALERSTMVRLRSRQGGYRWTEVFAAPAAAFPAPKEATSAKLEDSMLICRARWRPGRETASDASDAERSAFLAQMSQDLRGSLKSIVGYTDILRNELFGSIGNNRYREYARLAHDSGLHLLEQVDELIDLAEIESGRFAAKPEVIDLAPLVEGAARLVRSRAERSGVASRINTPQKPPRLILHRRALRRILVTMMLDALRSAKMGDALLLSAEIESDTLRFALRWSRRPSAELGDAETVEGENEAKDWGADAEASADSDARRGRLVIETLSQLMGGGLIFADATSSLDETDSVYAELFLPVKRDLGGSGDTELQGMSQEDSDATSSALADALEPPPQADLFEDGPELEERPKTPERDLEAEALDTPLFDLSESVEYADAGESAPEEDPDDASTRRPRPRRMSA